MTPQQLQQKIHAHMEELKRFQREKLPDIIGTEAVNHFNESFAKEGFTDEQLNKWPDVKRRDPASPWYGFSPDNKKHFSQARATDKILTGETKELENATEYTKYPDKVTIHNDKPYAAVHQFGELAKVFGKKTFQMKPRPFIGKSAVLVRNIQAKMEREIKRIVGLN